MTTPGRHKHRCPECGTVWDHSDACTKLPWRERTLTHSSPRCRTVAGEKYDGPEPAEFSDHHTTHEVRP